MDKRYVLPAIVSAALSLPLLSQTDFDYTLALHKGNKIVLLGDWKPADRAKWKEVVDSDDIYGYSFTLLDRNDSTYGQIGGYGVKSIEGFEAWFRRQYALSGGIRWAALDLENKLITSGVNTPEATQLEQLLDQRGLKSPLRILRDFLLKNPDHLDAKTDLLKEARRRALHKMPDRTPANLTEDLDTESDLRAWGILAAETDRVFSGAWLGVDLDFFRPDRGQPERYSKLMRAAFSKHIPKAESALRIEPLNNTLWNIWAWMARSLPDYRWDRFVNSFEPFTFVKGNIISSDISIPPGDVSAWVVEEARAKKDWGTVIKFAQIARHFSGYVGYSRKQWGPGGGVGISTRFDHIKGYPVKSAYAPYLEALLRLGDIEEANNVFDKMIRIEGEIIEFSNGALVAANVARDVGMEELAKIWEQGEQINKVPYLISPFRVQPEFFIFTENNNDDYRDKFNELSKQLSPSLIVQASGRFGDIDPLGWKKDDGHRWALLAIDGEVLAQGFSLPELDGLQGLLNRFNIKKFSGLAKDYIVKHGSSPGIELCLAALIINENTRKIENSRDTLILDDNLDEDLFGEATRYYNKILTEYPDILINIYYFYTRDSIQSSIMKSLSKQMLSNIESLLYKKPSSEALWNQWLFWNQMGGGEQLLEPIIERIEPSPLSQIGTVPPAGIMESYYEESKKNGNWPVVIKLLKTLWELDLQRMALTPDEAPGISSGIKDYFGDGLGILLIEAYLKDNKPGEADAVFNTVLNSGGKFTDISKIAELAKTKGHESLAREWENKVKARF